MFFFIIFPAGYTQGFDLLRNIFSGNFFLNRHLSSNSIAILPERVFATLEKLEMLKEKTDIVDLN